MYVRLGQIPIEVWEMGTCCNRNMGDWQAVIEVEEMCTCCDRSRKTGTSCNISGETGASCNISGVDWGKL